MGINELCELIAKALADGKHVTYDYSEDEATGYDREYQWSHVVSAKMDGQDLVLGLNNGYGYDMWPLSVSDNDQSAIDDLIARVAIYDTLFAPKDVALGTGKTLIRNVETCDNGEFPLSVTGAFDEIRTVYKVENTGTKIDGYKARYAYEVEGGMRFI